MTWGGGGGGGGGDEGEGWSGEVGAERTVGVIGLSLASVDCVSKEVSMRSSHRYTESKKPKNMFWERSVSSAVTESASSKYYTLRTNSRQLNSWNAYPVRLAGTEAVEVGRIWIHSHVRSPVAAMIRAH